MCYAKPGPRCDAEARRSLASASQAYAEDPSEANQNRLADKLNDYRLTNAGIAEMRSKGDFEMAQDFENRREKLIRESKFLRNRANDGKWSSIPLKEMDPGALTMALIEASEDETIDWGTSSPEKFAKAINAATFWHRDQTRKNRAGFPRTPYIEHPLRGALRAYRWGCTDGETLTAIVLHDTLEDCADKISREPEKSAQEQRAIASKKLKAIFGDETVQIVEGVSNPIQTRKMTKVEKRAVYKAHVEESLTDPKIFITKLSDFADNAGGLHHNYIEGQEGMVTSMHAKYSMVMPVFKEAYERLKDDLPMGSNYRVEIVLGKIERNLEKLGKRLESDGRSA